MNGRKLSSVVRGQGQLQKFARGALFCLGLATLPFAGSCGRWTPARDYVAESKTDAESAYQKLLAVLAQKRYSIVEQRAGEHYAKVRAHVDEDDDVSHQSFIAAQVDAAGVVRFTPSGYLLRGDKVHRKLADELLDLEFALRDNVEPQPEPSAPSSATPAPPPALEATAAPSAAPPPVVTPPPAPAAAPKPASKPKAATTPAPKAAPAPKPTAKPGGDDWVPVQ